jgi:uncharacterized membrane protein
MTTEADALRAELKKWHDHFQAGSRAWSLAHHITAYGAAILSVAVGFIVQRPETWTLAGISRNSLSTWLALLAAVLATVAATGGFERKWHSNRLSRSKVDLLRLDLIEPTPDVQAIRAELKQIITTHDRAIIGLLRETEGHGPPRPSEPERGGPQGQARPLSDTTA